MLGRKEETSYKCVGYDDEKRCTFECCYLWCFNGPLFLIRLNMLLVPTNEQGHKYTHRYGLDGSGGKCSMLQYHY